MAAASMVESPSFRGSRRKLGIDVGQTSVAKYMARRRRPPSQGWTTFLRNHADGIVAMDLFVVPTISFRLLYGLLILRHDRRRILWLGATAHPGDREGRTHAAFGQATACNMQHRSKRVTAKFKGPLCTCHGVSILLQRG